MPKPANSGTYCLIIKLDEACGLQVGRLGRGWFPAGYYCYVGSALKGLEQRLARHRAAQKRKHWHIDYFLGAGRIVEVGVVRSGKRLECRLSAELERIAQDKPMAGFGSSDCRCRTHLYFFKRNPWPLVRTICQDLEERHEGGLS